MKKFIQGVFALSILGLLTFSCSPDDSDDADGGGSSSGSITGLDFTISSSGLGNTVSITPSATGATVYSVNFGDESTTDDDAVATAGAAVSYTYPSEDATYTVTVTASASGLEDVTVSKEHIVTIEIVQTDAVGRWVLLHDAGALAVGSALDNLTWWSNSGADVTTRSCLFDDVYVLNSDGSFENILGDPDDDSIEASTWLEPDFHGTVTEEECGTPIAPYDGTASATWFHDESAGTITITGKGAYLGLQKVVDNATITSVSEALESVTYSNVTFSEDKNQMTISVPYPDAGGADGISAYWQFIFAKEGSAGASLDQTDSDGDGIIDVNDTCPNEHGGTNADGCPTLDAPTTGAPAPTTDASGVIAVYSDTYSAITVTNFNPGWGQDTVYTTEMIDGNNTIKLTSLNYQGIELDYDNATDVSGKTKVRFSYWTPNADNVAFKIVNTSEPDGVTKELEVSKAGLTTGEWGVAEFDLATDFDTVNKTGITQLVLVSATANATFYIDDIYFY